MTGAAVAHRGAGDGASGGCRTELPRTCPRRARQGECGAARAFREDPDHDGDRREHARDAGVDAPGLARAGTPRGVAGTGAGIPRSLK